MSKILIATTNKGKFEEFVKEFSDLDLEFLSLKDVGLEKYDIEEPYTTTWENALHKAKFFAKKTKLPTLSEDTGFYVKALNNDPGIKAKRWADTPQERNNKILRELKGIKEKDRDARFETDACFYEPENDSFTIFKGKVNGKIIENTQGKSRVGLQYDAIFYYPPLKKTFAELSISEKNLVSHRGQIMAQLKKFLTRHYSFKQLMVVGGIIVKDRKMLLQKRRDTRKEFNNKWEFVGGGVDNGESVPQALKREVKEESGYSVEIVEQLPEIITKTESKYGYQVFLLLYICKIKSGKLTCADTEATAHGWFTIKEALKLDSLPANKVVIRKNISILKKYVD